MKHILVRVVALAVVGFAVYRGLQMLGILGGDEAVEFEWADDATD
jgi:hypothetical protein